MTREHVSLVRLTIAFLGAIALAIQIFAAPQFAADMARRYPEVAHLERPYLGAVIVAFLAFEVALLAAWRVLDDVARGSQQVARSRHRATTMAGALIIGALVLAAMFVHAALVEKVGGPSMLLGLLLVLALVPTAIVLRARAIGFVSGSGATDASVRPA